MLHFQNQAYFMNRGVIFDPRLYFINQITKTIFLWPWKGHSHFSVLITAIHCNLTLIKKPKSISHLQLVQNTAARLQTNVIPASLHWVSVRFRTDLKILLLRSKAFLHGCVSGYVVSVIFQQGTFVLCIHCFISSMYLCWLFFLLSFGPWFNLLYLLSDWTQLWSNLFWKVLTMNVKSIYYLIMGSQTSNL